MIISKELKKLGEIYKKEENRVWMKIPKKDLLKIMEELKHGFGVRRVSSISGYDNGKEIEVIYHLEFGHELLNLKAFVSKKSNAIDSITGIFPSANLFERELAEMLGIKIKGHPNLKKLFLPEEINHPLRKD